MRPVNRLNGAYYETESGSYQQLSPRHITRLAACAEYEMHRLSCLIQGIAVAIPGPMNAAAYTTLHTNVSNAVAAGAPAMDAPMRAAFQAAVNTESSESIRAFVGAMPANWKQRLIAEVINQIAAYNASATPFQRYGIRHVVRLAIGLPANSIVFGGNELPIKIMYDAAIEALPAHVRNIDNYIHYFLIRKNLDYTFRTATTGGTSGLTIECIPYAEALMHSVQYQLSALAAGSTLYAHSTTAGPFATVRLGVAPAPVAAAGDHIVPISPDQLGGSYTQLYRDWNRQAEETLPYVNATRELLDILGPYCTYCESRITNEMNVEHMLPKGIGSPANGTYNGFSPLNRSWNNFMPACGRCNSKKGSKPTKRAIVDEALSINAAQAFTKDDGTLLNPIMTGGSGDYRMTNLEYSQFYSTYYQFPTEENAYHNMGYELHEKQMFGTAVYNATTIPAQIGWTIKGIDHVTKAVIVNTPGAATPTMKFRVYTDTTGGAASLIPSPQHRKLDKMRDLCKLNTDDSNTDRRILERTEAWFMALEAVSNIQRDLASIPGGTPVGIYNSAYGTWKENVIRTIKEKGFLTLWLKIFAHFQHPLTPNGTLPTYPPAPNNLAAGQSFLPMINGAAAGMPGGAAPARGANITNLAQDIAQTILQTGDGVSAAATNAAGIRLAITPPAAGNTIPLAGANGVGLVNTWVAVLAGAGGAAQIAAAEEAARLAGATQSRYFPNTNWNNVPS